MDKKEFHDQLVLFLATGLHVGKIPLAPGTFGTLWGIPLGCLLHGLSLPWLAGAVTAVVLVSVWLAGRAAAVIGEKDPSMVVTDEIAGMAVSLCMFPCSPGYVIACFFLFRLFDIWKPWPVDRLEELPGGWGIVMDDIMAGLMAGTFVQTGVFISHVW